MIIIYALHELLLLVVQPLGRHCCWIYCFDYVSRSDDELSDVQSTRGLFPIGGHMLIQLSTIKTQVFFICRSFYHWAMTLLKGNYQRPFSKPSYWLLETTSSIRHFFTQFEYNLSDGSWTTKIESAHGCETIIHYFVLSNWDDVTQWAERKTHSDYFNTIVLSLSDIHWR